MRCAFRTDVSRQSRFSRSLVFKCELTNSNIKPILYFYSVVVSYPVNMSRGLISAAFCLNARIAWMQFTTVWRIAPFWQHTLVAAAFQSKISVSKEVSYKAAMAQVLALYLCCKFTIIPPDMSIRAARFETLFGEVLRVLQQFSRSHRNANMHKQWHFSSAKLFTVVCSGKFPPVTMFDCLPNLTLK